MTTRQQAARAARKKRLSKTLAVKSLQGLIKAVESAKIKLISRAKETDMLVSAALKAHPAHSFIADDIKLREEMTGLNDIEELLRMNLESLKEI